MKIEPRSHKTSIRSQEVDTLQTFYSDKISLKHYRDFSIVVLHAYNYITNTEPFHKTLIPLKTPTTGGSNSNK